MTEHDEAAEQKRKRLENVGKCAAIIALVVMIAVVIFNG